MNIKTNREREFKIPSLWFNTVTANSAFGIIVFGLLMNYIIQMTGIQMFEYLGQAIFVILVWLIFVGFAASIGEAFKKSGYNDSDYKENVADLKKSLVYLVMLLSVLITAHNLNKPIPQPAPPNLTVQIDSIQIYEIHTNVDEFAIRYMDSNGKELFSDVYKQMKDRDATVGRILDTNGKPKVSLVYKRINGKKSVEIGSKPIKL